LWIKSQTTQATEYTRYTESVRLIICMIS
jgi:hypothetical protein